jgi:hypothetical protein
MHARAIHDAADGLGGRWGRQAQPTVIGSATAPNLPAPAWSHDPVGDEPPINFEADSALPDLTTLDGFPREELPPEEPAAEAEPAIPPAIFIRRRNL